MSCKKTFLAAMAAACLAAGCGGSGGETSPPVAAAARPMAASGIPTFPKQRKYYVVTPTATGYSVTDAETGSTQQAVGVQALAFADVTVNLTVTARAATIAAADLQTLIELYVAFFNRVPDADGLAFWIGQFAAGQPIDRIADGFYAAAVQYSDLTGYSSTMDNDAFVRVIYKNVLGRTGDTAPPQADVSFWSGELSSGRETKGSLVRRMLASAHSFKGNAQWGWVADLLDNKVSVANSFAVTQGLNYNSAQESIVRTMAIAASITPTSTSEATALINAIFTSTAGTGPVASYDEAAIPGYNLETGSVVGFTATNRGLYMSVSDLQSDATTVLKLHGNPIFNDWSSATFAGGVARFAPGNVYSERDREVNFYWHQVGIDAKWGNYVANTGDIGFDMPDDVGIANLAAGGTSGIVAPRPWVVARGAGNINSDYQYVWQDDGQYTSVRRTSDHFGTPAGTENVAGLADALLLAHPTDGTLFVAAGNKLHVYSASGRLSTTEISADASSSVTDMFWHGDTLWFNYGSRIFRRTGGGAISQFTQLTGTAGMLADYMPVPGRFCLNGGDIVGADGLATRVSDGAVRSWISKGTLTPAQQAQAAILEASVGGAGVFCSPDNLARAIYTPNLAEGKIRMITGL